jgi:hypothetical protein
MVLSAGRSAASQWWLILEKRLKVLLNSWGFVPVVVLPAHVKDYCSNTHDLIIMELSLPKPEAEEPSIF